MNRRLTFSYAWIIIAVALISEIIVYGARHSFSVFFPPILDAFGWARGSTALMFSLNLLVYGLMAPLAGGVGDRWNPRRIMPLGALLVALSLAGCALANELWHFYILFGVLVPMGIAFSGWPLFAPAVANWFAKKRGLAMGLGLMGGGLSFTIGMFVDHLISLVEWRWTFVVLASLVVGIVIPLIVVFFYSRPEHKGLAPYGIKAVPVAGVEKGVQIPVERKSATEGWTFRQALCSYRLWLIIMSQLLYWGIASYMVVAHQVRFAEDVGYSSTFAAFVFLLSGIFIAVGQVSGFLADIVGRERTLTLATVLSVGSIVILLSVQDNSQPWMLYTHAVLFGFGGGLMLSALAAGAADIFYGKHFGAIYGCVLAGMGVGGAIGPWLGGFIHDVSGSYFSAFIVCIGAYCIACLSFWIAAPRRARKPGSNA